jgi:hypothetical protein
VQAGQSAIANIMLTRLEPRLRVDPLQLDFGGTATQLSLSVSNETSTGTVNWMASVNQAWITVTPNEGSVAESQQTITVTANRQELTPAEYYARIDFTSNAGAAAVTARMLVVDPNAPVLLLSVAQLDFDSITTERTMNIINAGTGTLEWSITASHTWLSLDPASGSNASGASRPLSVYVDRSGLPAGAYGGNLYFSSNGGQATLPVTMTVPVGNAPPSAPSNLMATALTNSQIRLNWTDNASNEEGFRINHKTLSGSWTEVGQCGNDCVSYTDNDLSPSTVYYYRVCAFNTSGSSTWSNEAHDTTLSSGIASIHVVYPNGGESLRYDYDYVIQWTTNGSVPNVDVVVLRGSDEWRAERNSLPNAGQYTMTPYFGFYPEASDYRIRIRSSNLIQQPDVYDDSDAPFSIGP